MSIDDRLDEEGRLVRTITGSIGLPNPFLEIVYPLGMIVDSVEIADQLRCKRGAVVIYHPEKDKDDSSTFVFMGELPDAQAVAGRPFSLRTVYPTADSERFPVEQRLLVFTKDGYGKPLEYVFKNPEYF